MPSDESATVVLAPGAKAPRLPLLPLLNVCAFTAVTQPNNTATLTIPTTYLFLALFMAYSLLPIVNPTSSC
jgi:hypothetical protein